MWRKDNFSRYRVKCADYEHRHKKPIHQKARGTPFQEVGVLATQLMNLGYEVYSGDRLCIQIVQTNQQFREAKKEEWSTVKSFHGIQSRHYWAVNNGNLTVSRTAKHHS